MRARTVVCVLDPEAAAAALSPIKPAPVPWQGVRRTVIHTSCPVESAGWARSSSQPKIVGAVLQRVEEAPAEQQAVAAL